MQAGEDEDNSYHIDNCCWLIDVWRDLSVLHEKMETVDVHVET